MSVLDQFYQVLRHEYMVCQVETSISVCLVFSGFDILFSICKGWIGALQC